MLWSKMKYILYCLCRVGAGSARLQKGGSVAGFVDCGDCAVLWEVQTDADVSQIMWVRACRWQVRLSWCSLWRRLLAISWKRNAPKIAWHVSFWWSVAHGIEKPLKEHNKHLWDLTASVTRGGSYRQHSLSSIVENISFQLQAWQTQCTLAWQSIVLLQKGWR